MIDTGLLALALGFGIAFMGIGLKNPRLMMLSGLVWIYSAIAVFYTNGAGWAVLTLGLGMFMLAESAMTMLRGDSDAP
jgi:hypothetical protein